MGEIGVTAASKAPPLALGLAEKLRRAAEDPRLRRQMRSLHGRFALRSMTDPQSATILFGRGQIEVVGGVDPGAHVVVTADLSKLGKPGAPKPKVEGALRHPVLVWRVSKILDARPATWPEAVEQFWRRSQDRAWRPETLRVVCTADGDRTEIVLGDPAAPVALEVHGPATALVALFNGDIHPVEALLGGEIRFLADQATMQRFIGLGQALMMGDAHGT